MKKLSVVLAVVLGLGLIFPVVGLTQGGRPEYKATGGVTLYLPWVAEFSTFSFTAQNLGSTQGRGQATWIDYNSNKWGYDVELYVNIDYAEYVGTGEMKFGGSVIGTNNPDVHIGDRIYFWVIDDGSPGIGNDWVNVSWKDLSHFSSDGHSVLGGNLVVHD